MHRSRERNKGREGKIQKRVKRCKRKGKVLFMKIRNKREEEGENRRQGYIFLPIRGQMGREKKSAFEKEGKKSRMKKEEKRKKGKGKRKVEKK